MSVKIMGLIWDLDLESNKKFVLLAYADHANHEGGSIWPAVNTIVKKTGYHERSVQRITRELEESGYLVADGEGPKGTNRWRIPLNKTGDKIAPLTNEARAGDVPLGDIPLGDKIAPKLTTVKEPSLPLEWKIAAGQEITQDDLNKEQQAINPLIDFEKSFGFGTLPWNSTTVWDKFAKFVIKYAQVDPGWPADYVKWREDGGKYRAFSNRKIRENPQMFIDTGYPEYDASKMYRDNQDNRHAL